MKKTLNEFLGEKLKVLHMEKWAHFACGVDYSKTNGYFEMVLLTNYSYNISCNVSVQDFQVVMVSGQMYVSDIRVLNKALAKLRLAIEKGVAK